ncbi:MAG: T9SS type A sorting domain-containing protein [Bacteroidetes bacterium]|nr:T9SS type A sorting domain-containing protein [Bacteroidota bacterium]
MDNSTGIYQIWTAPIDFSYIDGAAEERKGSLSFELEQNFPNSFSTSTTISYHVPVYGFVSLKIMDAFGTELSILVNENKLPGYHKVIFTSYETNFRNGVYFYRLKVGDYSETKRMILLQ